MSVWLSTSKIRTKGSRVPVVVPVVVPFCFIPWATKSIGEWASPLLRTNCSNLCAPNGFTGEPVTKFRVKASKLRVKASKLRVKASIWSPVHWQVPLGGWGILETWKAWDLSMLAWSQLCQYIRSLHDGSSATISDCCRCEMSCMFQVT